MSLAGKAEPFRYVLRRSRKHQPIGSIYFFAGFNFHSTLCSTRFAECDEVVAEPGG
jgi:hypothetical protein